MTNVKTVAQALRRIKELKGKIAQVTTRLQQSVCWTEPGVKPIYDYHALYKERESLVTELVDLKARLVKTNSLTEVTFGTTTLTMQQAIFALSEIKATREFLRTLSIKEGEGRGATGEYDEHGHPKYVVVKLLAAIGLKARDELVEKLEKQITELHELIETENHRTVLLPAHG